jgi:short-subunit dehydrogenase
MGSGALGPSRRRPFVVLSLAGRATCTKRRGMRTVVITGASSGIGHAAAREFAKRGYAVVLAARGERALREMAAELEREGGTALAVPTDVASFEEVERLAQRAIDFFGHVDVWVNNASVAEWATIEDLDLTAARRILDVDLLGTIHGVKAILPHFRERDAGAIVNVGSALSDRAIPLLSMYCAAKAAVKSFTDSLRMELADAGANISVTLILPSSINTPFYRWGRSRLGVRPHPVSVIYPPSAVAKAIVSAAERPQREIFVGLMGKLLSIGERVSPALMDAYMTQNRRMFREQYSSRPDRGQSNLFASPEEHAVDGDFTGETRRGSLWTSLIELRPALRKAALAIILFTASIFIAKLGTRGSRGKSTGGR